MLTNFLLAFKDPQDQQRYNKERQSEIIKISSLLLLQRAIFIFVMLFNHFLEPEVVTKIRIVYYGISVGIHLVLVLILYYRGEVSFIQYLHGPLVLLSHVILVFNKALSVDQFVAFYG